LKHFFTAFLSQFLSRFLYIDPLKQGLKRNAAASDFSPEIVFIHRSIKTRIETTLLIATKKKGLLVFIHRSIKTRIETNDTRCPDSYYG